MTHTLIDRGGRVFIQDLKPIAVPSSLSDLRGPSDGRIELPARVLWSGRSRVFDLSSSAQVRRAYRAVLNEGRIDDVSSLVNRDLLIEHWAKLMLANEVLQAWHERFPELRFDS